MIRFSTAAIAAALALVCTAAAPPAPAQSCGDRAVEGDETCDDGNAVGGDGCAANCTDERSLTFTVGGGSNFNVQGRFAQLYPPGGLPLSGSLVLTIGAPRASDANASVPFVIRLADARFDPVALDGSACLCARPVIPDAFPSLLVAQGMLGCGSGALAPVDYELSRDHNIIDVDPQCTTGTLHPDGHCIGPLERRFTGSGTPGGATVEMGFRFYELSNCNGTPGDPDQRGCTDDDPVSVPTQRVLLTTGSATGEIVNADNTDTTIAPGQLCGSQLCDADRTGAPFDCAALLNEPPAAITAALAGVDVAVHLATLDDLVTVMRLELTGPILLPTPTQTTTPTDTATATPTGMPIACGGDCDGDGAVGIGELIRGVNIAIGVQPSSTCPAFDSSGDGTVSVSELIQAVNASLTGCNG